MAQPAGNESQHGLLALGLACALALGVGLAGRQPPPLPPGVAPVQGPTSVETGRGRMQQVPIGTSIISGTVTAADSGQAIRNALVTISGNSNVLLTQRGGGASVGMA